ncbi:MAG: NAD(P)-dependent alcohol dehydrogenase [Gammaproteobacteria bacterium]|nr:NAD(P)-dependent alcohol dehydrogenase [Gammaproteobacteria bacterium]
MRTITAAVALSPDLPFTLRELELEAPQPDEILVRIVATGICHTDISVKNQSVKLPLPMVLGHEGAGVVEAVGSAVTHLQPGDHVVMAGDSCGYCNKCQQSLPFYCDEFVTRNLTGWRRDGTSPLQLRCEPLRGRFVGQSSFATHSVVPARAAIRIDKDLPLELMGPLGCGLTTGAGTVLNALRPRPGSSIAVFGCGTVGLAAVMGARLAGSHKIIVIDPMASRREMALSVGATEAIDPATEDVVGQILASTRGGADFSVECSGVASVIPQAIACLGRPGMCAQVGAPPGGTIMPVDMDHLGFGRGIKGVVMGDANPQTFVPYLAALWRDGRLPFDRFVRYYPLNEINTAIADASKGDVIKPILRMP